MLTWIKKFFKRKPVCDHRFDIPIVNDLNNDDPNCKLCGLSFSIITGREQGYRYEPINDMEFKLVKAKKTKSSSRS
jgi:hypothetical protein